jgi:hypothetical protein
VVAGAGGRHAPGWLFGSSWPICASAQCRTVRPTPFFALEVFPSPLASSDLGSILYVGRLHVIEIKGWPFYRLGEDHERAAAIGAALRALPSSIVLQVSPVTTNIVLFTLACSMEPKVMRGMREHGSFICLWSTQAVSGPVAALLLTGYTGLVLSWLSVGRAVIEGCTKQRIYNPANTQSPGSLNAALPYCCRHRQWLLASMLSVLASRQASLYGQRRSWQRQIP